MDWKLYIKFTRVMTFLLALLDNNDEIITYIDDILIQVDAKTQMFDQLRNFYETLSKSKLKAAPNERYFFLSAVIFLAHINTKN